MKLLNTRHIFFDLDHTLWDFDKNSSLAFSSIFNKNKIAVELEVFLQAYSPINSDYWRLYRQDKVTKAELRYGRLKKTFESIGINLTDEQIDQLSEDYMNHLLHYNHLLEGAVDLLEYLYPNYSLHIITNGFEEVQHRKLERSGILKYFSTITTSEDAGVKKPDSRIFEVALKKAKASPGDSVMIGDNFEADILGAEQAGMRAILYNYHAQKFSTDCHQVLKMKELASYF